MNGAQALIRTLAGCGVEVCFSNPGTSEMHFVAALDAVPEMHGVLCLFEGVATGAADGYGRMSGRPAAALLHLGPGLANGLANLHNARRARTPLLAVVGDHATHHKRFDAPLESDIDALARSVSAWIRRPARPEDLAGDAAEAVAAAMRPPGGIATLILPADVSWSEGAEPASPLPFGAPAPVPDDVIGSAAAALSSGEPCVILLGGAAVRRPGLEAASRVAQVTGARLLCETFPARHERGAGIPALERLAYLAEFATQQLAGARHLILAGARAPVSFFAYPGKPSSLVPAGGQVHVLAEGGDDVPGALASLADLVAPGAKPVPHPGALQPSGRGRDPQARVQPRRGPVPGGPPHRPGRARCGIHQPHGPRFFKAGFDLGGHLCFLHAGDDRSRAPHADLPHLQEAARVLGRREGALPPDLRRDQGGERRHVLDRRGRIRRVPRAERRREDDDPEDALGPHIPHVGHGPRRRIRSHEAGERLPADLRARPRAEEPALVGPAGNRVLRAPARDLRASGGRLQTDP